MKLAIDEYGVLQCPGCGGHCLHHESINVFSRKEDAENTVVTQVGRRVTIVRTAASEDCDNPSPRRDGLLVYFTCELCECEPVLQLWQHKGSTYLKWENVK